MKVKELIEKLKELDENTEVILSADEEGNYYNNLRNIEEGYFIEGEYYSEEWSADDCCLDEDEWESMRSKENKCITLFP